MTKGSFSRRWFKPVPDYPGYWINARGRVYSELSGKFLATSLNSKYYVRVQLMNGKKSRHVLLHRLVAIVFKPNPENKAEVNHDDWNTLNYDAKNLTWMTPRENREHRKRKPWLSPEASRKLREDCPF